MCLRKNNGFGCINYFGFLFALTQGNTMHTKKPKLGKGHPYNADLKYGEKDSFSPSTLILAAIKG